MKKNFYRPMSLAFMLASFLVLPLMTACGEKGDNSDYHFPYQPDEENGSNSDWKGDPSDFPTEEWYETEVQEGITWHYFNGYEEISGANQIINILEVDLNNTRYKLNFHYSESGVTLPQAMARYDNAVCGINGAYEVESIYIKTEGTVNCDELVDYIPGTSVPQWKNDGAVWIDENGTVGFTYIDSNTTSLQEQKTLLAAMTYPNIFSSAAMLINDHVNVGVNFVDTQGKSQSQLELEYASEDPIRHQGGTNPRTAIALTDDNHLLLVTVDGRRDNTAGMSVGALATFLQSKFDPAYALNMDGGGSTTMCIKGWGDESTNVVNYPTDNNQFDHAGTRSVSSFFVITDSEMQ